VCNTIKEYDTLQSYDTNLLLELHNDAFVEDTIDYNNGHKRMYKLKKIRYYYKLTPTTPPPLCKIMKVRVYDST